MPAAAIAAYQPERPGPDKTRLCHAPTSSMYFGRDGLVTACCYSRANPYGRYPAQSVRELWAGEWRRDMARQIDRKVLPYGCGNCMDQLCAGNFRGLLAAMFDSSAQPATTKRAAISRAIRTVTGSTRSIYPTTMEFELSNTCNLECAMCSGEFSSLIRARRDGLPPLPQVYDSTFVEQLQEFIPHLRQAKFHGGEPFLIDIYYDIWEQLIALNPGCQVSITTNGTTFSPKVRRVLERLNCHIVVSLDSLTKATYEAIRVNATLEQTLLNVDRFHELTALPNKGMSIAACPMTSNWRELPALVEFANQRKIEIFFNTVTYPKAVSPKFWSADALDEALTVLCAAVRAGSTVLERHNYGALNGVCRQLAMWLGQRRVPTREA